MSADPGTLGIRFREDFGCWWPDYDHKPETCFMLVNRDCVDSRIATSLCRRVDVCVQAGGHAGFWPLELSRSFKNVRTFEPEPALFECLARNMAAWPKGTRDRVIAERKAIGSFIGEVSMRPHCSAGSWSVTADGTVLVPQVTIDSLNLGRCDAIFLDIEGYEVEALKGAGRTIEKFRPILHVEMLERSADGIREHLARLKYRKHVRIHKDEIYVPR